MRAGKLRGIIEQDEEFRLDAVRSASQAAIKTLLGKIGTMREYDKVKLPYIGSRSVRKTFIAELLKQSDKRLLVDASESYVTLADTATSSLSVCISVS